MRLAYIVTAHKYPEQLARLIDRLNGEGTSFFVHVDKKTDAATYDEMVAGLRRFPNVRFLRKRFACYYMTLFGAVQAQLQALREIFESNTSFDYLLYVTGQDYPIKSNADITATLGRAGGKSFICHFPLPFEGVHPSGGKITQPASRIECWHFYICNHYVRFPLRGGALWARALNRVLPKKRQFPKGFQPHGGWAYWCLTREHAEYVHRFAETHPAFVNYFRFVKSADEIFMQTVLLNSEFKDQIINDDLRYVDWSSRDCSPRILRATDLPKLAAVTKLFARKFDSMVDVAVLNLIDEQLLSAKPAAAPCEPIKQEIDEH
jgi:hypothetical protein